ncbi:hypothetical protein ACFOU2_21270 [Bacillus songklensis]|uniref:DUF1980 domain-containing protein n=2 Tax=Bacillus songklensis TaxID=1069116 RepID=A0ABV8B6D8_9BACI
MLEFVSILSKPVDEVTAEQILNSEEILSIRKDMLEKLSLAETLIFKTDEWIKVKGTLSDITYSGSLLPYIQIEQIERIKPPKNPYVYEFYEGERLITP